MKTATLTLACALLVMGCGKGTGAAGPAPKLVSDQDKTFYALGLLLGRNISNLSLSPSELALVQAGVADAANGAPAKVELDTYGKKVNEIARARASAHVDQEKGKGKAFAEKAAHEAGATQTPSGLVIRTITPGTGESPQTTDVVKVNYQGALIDGTEFDSSIKRGQPAEFPLDRVIPCWTEGVQRMKVGEKARLVCPSSIAYRDTGQPPRIPGGATLVFEIELLGITKQPAQPNLSVPGLSAPGAPHPVGAGGMGGTPRPGGAPPGPPAKAHP